VHHSSKGSKSITKAEFSGKQNAINNDNQLIKALSESLVAYQKQSNSNY